MKNNKKELVNATDLLADKNIYEDLLWLAGNKIRTQRIIRFACDCALLNIEKVKPYTDKYDAILTFLKGPSASDVAVAAIRSDAALSAAVATHAIRSDATLSAAAITRGVIGDGDATTRAVAATTRAAAAAEISRESKQKVDDLLIEMFSELE